MKKHSVISCLLAFFLCFVIAMPAWAAETDGYVDGIEPHISFVATVRIVSIPGSAGSVSSGSFGHSFLTFKNTSNSTITVGHMPVKPNQSVTIGTFGNRKAHTGIWYNIEGYAGIPSESYALVTGVTASELAIVNDVINANDSWTLTNNCSAFAVKVWNATPAGNKVSGGNPAALANSIRSYDLCITNPSIVKKALSTVAYHTDLSYNFAEPDLK
jgi:hypothetical protein